MAELTPKPKMQFFDSAGIFLSGGKVYTYEAGTSTPLATYTDQTEAQENTNPVVLDVKGQAAIWLGSDSYKLVVYDSSDVLQPDGGDNIQTSAGLADLYKVGIVAWDPLIEYGLYSLTNFEGEIYTSLSPYNVGNDPSTDSINWSLRPILAVSSIEDLRLTAATSAGIISVKGYYAPGDGGGGIFYWDSLSTSTDNNGTIIKVTDVISGRWKRLYTGAVSVRWFGAKGDGTTDDTAALQAAIDFSTNISINAGTYVCTSELTYNADVTRSKGLQFIGDGSGTTIFDNQVASGFLLNINQEAASKFHLGSVVRGFTINTTTSPILSSGIQIRASTFTEIDGLLIDGLSGEGIVVSNTTEFDTDQNTNTLIHRNTIRSCGGWGIYCDYTTSAFSGYRIERNRILDCAGAIRASAATGCITLNGISQSTTYPQVLIAHNGLANNYSLELSNNFFEKGRAGELQIDGLGGGIVEHNVFTSNDSLSGPFAVKIGYSQRVNAVTLRANRHIVSPIVSGTYTCYDIGAMADGNNILDPIYNDISTSAKIAYENSTASSNGNVTQDTGGTILHPTRLESNSISSTGGAVPIDPANGQHIIIDCSSTGSHILTTPSSGTKDGTVILIGLYNSSGGTITVTFGSVYSVSGFTDPLNGFSTYSSFIYNSITSKWQQICAWS